jgi:hypothetical protein
VITAEQTYNFLQEHYGVEFVYPQTKEFDFYLNLGSQRIRFFKTTKTDNTVVLDFLTQEPKVEIIATYRNIDDSLNQLVTIIENVRKHIEHTN